MLGILDAQGLDVLERRQPGGAAEAAVEGPLGQARSADELADDVDERSLAFFLEVIPIGTALGLAYGDNLPDPARWDEFLRRVFRALEPTDS